jgi:thiol-disulfide isomerase/thioredoxin
VRPLLALSLFACMLGLTGLTGCNLPKRSKGSGASSATGQPFVGSPSSDPAPTPTSDDNSTLASKQGVKAGKGSFAGEVLDTARRRVADASIKITEVDPGKEAAAPLTVTTDKGGYFDVSGLDAGRVYRLVARKRDGNRSLTGSVRLRCPNVRVVIPLTGEESLLPNERVDEKTNSKEETKASQTSPGAAALGPPVKSPQADSVPPPAPDEPRHAPPPPQPGMETVPNLPTPQGGGAELIGKEKNNGFENRSLPANIPSPGSEPKRKPVEPPPPPMRDGNDVGLKPSRAPSAVPAGSEDPQSNDQTSLPTRVVVPSCVKVGQYVRNFALYDYDGKVWELSKKRQGRLVLIDFWFSKCIPCKTTIPYLNDLNKKYRAYGLDVVSIAHEKGTPVEKQDAVRKVRETINYPILFTGGGNEADCPVLKQLEIHEYPTLILLDRSGKILWRGNGLSMQAKYQLEMYVRKQLGLPTS